MLNIIHLKDATKITSFSYHTYRTSFFPKDPRAASAATRVQASRIPWRLLLAAKASRRLGCRKLREMETLAKLASLENGMRKKYTNKKDVAMPEKPALFRYRLVRMTFKLQRVGARVFVRLGSI